MTEGLSCLTRNLTLSSSAQGLPAVQLCASMFMFWADEVTLDEAAIASAVAGLGIAASSMPREEIENGSLVHILPDWDFGSMEINALFVSGKSIKPAARAFVDFLIREGSARPCKER